MRDWLYSLFIDPTTPLQAIIILSMIIAAGSALGKIKFFGISLGVTFVFFVGILMGHLGFQINQQMLRYAQDFGLVIFVYELGLQVGPGFFSSFRQGGLRLNMLALGAVLITTAMTIGFGMLDGFDMQTVVGIMCGATTNTPALGAAQQTLSQMGHDATSAALGWAVAYPLGVVGIILAMVILKQLFVHNNINAAPDAQDKDNTFVATFIVDNPGIVGASIQEIGIKTGTQFIISRLWRGDKVIMPKSDMVLNAGDKVLVVTDRQYVEQIRMLFGTEENKDWNKRDIDWNTIDNQFESQIITITEPGINGKKLGSLKIRNSYGINITRVMRSGVRLLARPDLVLQLGDRLAVVGEKQAINNVEKLLGNKVKTLHEPNLVSTFIGIILGLIIGSIPIAIPGISQPIRLGLAGGPIVVGIFIARFGPRFHLVTYTTESANLMLRSLGIELYLACLGLNTGAKFFETVMCPEGLMWVFIGFLITVVPVLTMGIYAYKIKKMDFGNTCGMMCGSTNNPMALGYANATIPGDSPAVSYATVYPLCMFAKVIIAQLLIMIFV